MQKEQITQTQNESVVTITGNKIVSILHNDYQTTVVKVYENGYMGKSLGSNNENLEEIAKNNLIYQIPYPAVKEQINGEKSLIIDNIKETNETIFQTISDLLTKIISQNSDFLFNNKIYLNQIETLYQNSYQAKYYHFLKKIDIALTIKHRNSHNIIDLPYFTTFTKNFNPNSIIEDITKLCQASLLPVIELPKEAIIICPVREILVQIVNDLRSDIYASGASLFNNKLNSKIFDERVNLLIDKTSLSPFFDDEGEVADNYQTKIIENGQLKLLFATRKMSEQYHISSSKNTKISESGQVELDFDDFTAQITNPSFQNVLGSFEGIYLVMTSGISILPGGDINIPVSLAFVYQEGQIKGKCEAFNLTGNIFKIFNQDFLGITPNSLFPSIDENYLIFKAKI